MSSTDKIIVLEAELADLNQQLTSQLSEQNVHDIRQQVIAIQHTLITLYKKPAPVGKKYSIHNITIEFLRIEYIMKTIIPIICWIRNRSQKYANFSLIFNY